MREFVSELYDEKKKMETEKRLRVQTVEMLKGNG